MLHFGTILNKEIAFKEQFKNATFWPHFELGNYSLKMLHFGTILNKEIAFKEQFENATFWHNFELRNCV